MLMAVAAEASVEIYPPGAKMWPTSSGKVYVSDGSRVLALTIRFWFPALSKPVTRLTEIVRADVS
jgi:hypothetical protein